MHVKYREFPLVVYRDNFSRNRQKRLTYNIFDVEAADSFKSGNVSASSPNCDDTQASPHFKLVNKNFSAFVHCSSELNWILSM